VLERLLGSVGIAGRQRPGEGIFIRFIQGEELDELDQQDASAKEPLSLLHGAMLVVLAMAGLGAAWAALALPILPVSADGTMVMGWVLLVAGIGYLILARALLRILFAGAGRISRKVTAIIHLPLYVTLGALLLLMQPNPGFSVLASLLLVLFAWLHLLLLLDRAQAQFRPRTVGIWSLRAAVIGASILMALVSLPVPLGGSPDTGFLTLSAVPFVTMLTVLAFTERPDEFRQIVRQFPHILLAAICGWIIPFVIVAALAAASSFAPTPPFDAMPVVMVAGIWAPTFLVIGYLIEPRFKRASTSFAVGSLTLSGGTLFLDTIGFSLAIGLWITFVAVGIASSFEVHEEPRSRFAAAFELLSLARSFGRKVGGASRRAERKSSKVPR
jgi:hypothetical protein